MLAAVSFFAQDSETLNIFASLGFGFPTEDRFSPHTPMMIILFTERKDNYFNYGQAIKLEAGIQYFMMENVALQLAFDFQEKCQGLKSKTIIISRTQHY